MLTRHDIMAGSPKLNYLTLPTALKDDDYQRFLAALEAFFVEYKEPLAALAAETAPGLEPSEEEQQIREALTTPYTPPSN